MEPEVMILLSGGVDSAACVKFYIDFGRPPRGLFIDYGQPAATYEVNSAIAISKHYSVPLTCLTWQGWLPKKVGLIPGRNFFLLSAALMEKPDFVSVIAMGIHAGTNYPDCSETFWARMQAVVDIYDSASVKLAAPFLTWSKSDIRAQKKLGRFGLVFGAGITKDFGFPSWFSKEQVFQRTFPSVE